MQSDAFFSECRMYGHLKEEGMENLAAKVYGYIQVFINDRTEVMFKPAFEGRGCPSLVTFLQHFDRVLEPGPRFRYSDRPLSVPIYGIVKEWAGGDIQHDPKSWDRPYEEQMAETQRLNDMLPQQLENLHELHRNGIVIRDVQQPPSRRPAALAPSTFSRGPPTPVCLPTLHAAVQP